MNRFVTKYSFFRDMYDKKTHAGFSLAKIEVEFFGNGWAVTDGPFVLSKDGEWEYQSMPSSRTEDFFKRCRYETAEEAFENFTKWLKKTVEDPKEFHDIKAYAIVFMDKIEQRFKEIREAFKVSTPDPKIVKYVDPDGRVIAEMENLSS